MKAGWQNTLRSDALSTNLPSLLRELVGWSRKSRPETEGWKVWVDVDHTHHDTIGGVDTVTLVMRAQRPDDPGSRSSYRSYALDVSIDLASYKYKKVQFVDQLKGAVDYLFLMPFPASPPKAFRRIRRR